jgi:hypothetical protein
MALATGLVIATSAVAVAAVEISEIKGRERILVDLKNATADEALQKLSKRYGFQIQASGAAVGAARLTAKLEGEPVALIRRLLRHHNHIIQMSSSKPIGIERIVIIAVGGQRVVPMSDRDGDGAHRVPPGSPRTVVRQPDGRPLPPGQRPRPPGPRPRAADDDDDSADGETLGDRTPGDDPDDS